MVLQIKNKLQQLVAGFSLIELMIVVAIIGVLASIAVPSYEGYLARARLTHLMAYSDDIRKKVTEYHAVNGAFPTTSAAINQIAPLPASDGYIQNSSGAIATAIVVSAATATPAATTALAVSNAGNATLSTPVKFSILGANTGFPGGDPVIQVTATFTAATASTPAILSWTCYGWGITSGSGTLLASTNFPSNYFPSSCPLASTALTW